METALIGLGGVALGAAVAVFTQRRGLRAEINRYWATQLHVAAADLAASYTVARSKLAQARQAGQSVAPPDEELQYEERRSAQGRLFTLPDGDALEGEADVLRSTLDALRDSYGLPDEDWALAMLDQEQALHEFQQRVRHILKQRSKP